MKGLIQRVKRASVTIDGKVYSKINQGILILLGVEKGDNEQNADKLADKLCKLRIFEDEDGNKINNVTFIGTLNSHQEGIYVLEYEVIDQWNQKLNGKCQVRVLRSPIINLDPDNNDSLNNDHVKDDLSDNNHKDN